MYIKFAAFEKDQTRILEAWETWTNIIPNVSTAVALSRTNVEYSNGNFLSYPIYDVVKAQQEFRFDPNDIQSDTTVFVQFSNLFYERNLKQYYAVDAVDTLALIGGTAMILWILFSFSYCLFGIIIKVIAPEEEHQVESLHEDTTSSVMPLSYEKL